MASIRITPKLRRDIGRIIPFGAIWLFTGWLFMVSESLLPKADNVESPTNINMTLSVFLFSAFALTTLGFLVGTLETLVLQRRFQGYSFRRKITFKFVIYMLIMLLAIAITYPTAAALESGLHFLHPRVWQKTGQFLGTPLFYNALLQLSFSLFLSLLYSAISENLGHNVLLNFYTGKYHKPVVESRIFMFLDMKDSTTIAEQLGHVEYFKLLADYYDLMSDPIVNHQGEVYQYIGDEVVVTWTAEKGFTENHCIQCFQSIKDSLQRQAASLERKYGLVPNFKAGIHIGEVTTGEIGALKKEIVYSGDVLNTAARIQGMCKDQQADLIISQQILDRLSAPADTQHLGEFKLRGKEESVVLHAVKFSRGSK